MLARAPAGRPLAEVTDPFALEVHRPVQPEAPPPGLPQLPAYVPREHDTQLGAVVRAAAAEGRSRTAVLVGGSSTGKTRACWEALQILRDRPEPWRLWHPIDPTRPDAALRELPGIGPRTVVWLNEAQFYLDVAEGGLGERVAAGLRELLRDPDRAPVLVLATLWPQYWDTLTARSAASPDPHAQARELLTGHDITVPTAFSPAQMGQLARAADARLALATAGAQDGQVIQFLAGAPELLARYRNAPPAAAALINAAMDARRLGIGVGLPQAFLEAAAPGYLTDAEWDALGEDWLDQALAYTAVPCKGVRGPLTYIRPRPARARPAGPGSPDGDDQPPASQAGTADGPVYRLADYLDQHGRAHRKDQIPPAGFWAAAAAHSSPGDQALLGHAAHARGLYHAAAQLHKNAAASGSSDAAYYLTYLPRCLRGDARPTSWAAAHVALDDPRAVVEVLDGLREEGAQDQVAGLLDRDPAAHVALDDPLALAGLLYILREAGAQDQVAGLLDRDPAAHVALDNPDAVATLLYGLLEAGARDQAATLAARAADVPLDYPAGVAELLRALRKAGAQEQAAALATRAAGHVPLDNPGALIILLHGMREAGAWDQVTALLDRDPAAHVALDDPDAVARLLDSLRQADAQDQATALAIRAAAHVALDDPDAVAILLTRMREAGARDQAATLAGRAAAHVALDDPDAVARLLNSLRQADAQDQATALATRAAAHVALDDPDAVARLLNSLRQADAQDQVTALLDRDPAAHLALDDPYAVAELLNSLRWAGAQDQVAALLDRDPAAHVALDDPYAVARLLDSLRWAGAQDQVAALLDRDPAAHVALDDPGAVARLLDSLRPASAQDQATALATRAAAHVALDDPDAVARLLDSLRRADAQDQADALAGRAAAHVALDDPGAIARLLFRLQALGTQNQADALAGQLPAAGLFAFVVEQPGADQFRFGREADGSPSEPWGWEDLDL